MAELNAMKDELEVPPDEDALYVFRHSMKLESVLDGIE
jgi:hypothetical protein